MHNSIENSIDNHQRMQKYKSDAPAPHLYVLQKAGALSSSEMFASLLQELLPRLLTGFLMDIIFIYRLLRSLYRYLHGAR